MAIEELVRPRLVLALKLASALNLKNELKNVILASLRSFAFLHSQGHERRSKPAPALSGPPQKADIAPLVAVFGLGHRSGGQRIPERSPLQHQIFASFHLAEQRRIREATDEHQRKTRVVH
jgi:hypothetical protein